MKKIVFIVPKIGEGGAEKVIVNIVNSLDTQVFDITLIYISDSVNTYRDLITNKINLIGLQKADLKSAFFSLYSLLKSIKPDIVFTSLVHFSVVSVLIKMLGGLHFKPIVRLAVTPTNPGRSIKAKLTKQTGKYLLKNVNCIIAQSEEMKADAKNFYGLTDDSVYYFPNVVNQEQITEFSYQFDPQFDSNSFNIVAAGRLVHNKGFDVLIKAMPAIVKAIPNAKLNLLGDEKLELGYRNKLENLTKELGMEDHVVLLGFRTNPYPYFKNANLFVLPSRKEGFPNVVLEALTLGVPVVVSNCVNFDKYIKQGDNGYIFPIEDSDALATAVIKAKGLAIKPLVLKNFDYNSFLLSR